MSFFNFFLNERAARSKSIATQKITERKLFNNVLSDEVKLITVHPNAISRTSQKLIIRAQVCHPSKLTDFNNATKSTRGWLNSFLPWTSEYELRQKAGEAVSMKEELSKKLDKYTKFNSPAEYDAAKAKNAGFQSADAYYKAKDIKRENQLNHLYARISYK